MEWKAKIEYQIAQASNYRKINAKLKKLAKLLLSGDTRFILVYSSGREQYITLLFKEKLKIETSRLLLNNGYKQIYLNNK